MNTCQGDKLDSKTDKLNSKTDQLDSRTELLNQTKGSFLSQKRISSIVPVRSPLNSHLCGCKTSKLNPLLQTAHFVNLWESYIYKQA